MPSHIEFPTSSALSARLNAIRDMARPGAKATTSARSDIRKIVIEDHTDKMLRGVDRYGQQRAPLAESTLKNKKRGSGPSLIPRGMLSRFITNLEVLWTASGTDQILTARLRDMPWAKYHFEGSRKMPRRDVSGITPKGWAAIVARQRLVLGELRRYGGGKG